MAVSVPAAAPSAVPLGEQSTLIQVQRQLVAESDASIVPKLIGALDVGSRTAHQIATQHPDQTSSGVGTNTDNHV